MSRSYKKNPVEKDGGERTYNKRNRRINKQRVKEGKYPLRLDETDDFIDHCDWKKRDNTNPKFKRK